LRFDLTYSYNTEWYVRPYQKNRLDTLVVPVRGQRPSFLRETLGAEFQYWLFTGKLGVGMEKEILDPVNDPNWGFEANIGVQWDLLPSAIGATFSIWDWWKTLTTLRCTWPLSTYALRGRSHNYFFPAKRSM
ncbi:MAG: hypothetical protein N2Z22_06955, partial [Turneriella sp.]|nr:hypothetical protein [Turneriella sp.]